jgi:glycosyltransferase involved in cell wall biosynthesis
MYKERSVAVVVPAYNEETQIGRVIETMPGFVDHIVIIDDKSRDRTSEVVRSYQEREGRVTLIRHEVNQGVGGAIATG